MPTTKKSESNHTPSLQRFALEDLAPFTKEGMFAKSASRDFHLFYVGRDDVHGILKYLLSRAMNALYLNMFGYDDDELNAECMRCAADRSITTVITLDKSQAGGVHERAILDADLHREPVAFNTHVVTRLASGSPRSATRGSTNSTASVRRRRFAGDEVIQDLVDVGLFARGEQHGLVGVVVVNYAEGINRLPWDEQLQVASDQAKAKHGRRAS